MKVLHLTLRKKWFDMIASGEKKEEYRELKPFWYNRLTSEYWINAGTPTASKHYNFLNFDAIKFYNGWAPSEKYKNITIEWKGIKVGNGKSEWGAEPGKEYFVIKLGEII